MFRREARRRGAEFHGAGTNWTCDPLVQQTASEIWTGLGNARFNGYVFGHLWPEQAEAKARDLLIAWTRARPDLVIAECSDLGAHLAAKVLGLPLLAADNGLGPVLLDLWDIDIAPALLPLYKQYEQDTPVLPPMVAPAPVEWFYPVPPPSARPVRRTVAGFRTILPGWLDRSLSSRPLVYVSLGTLTTAMTGRSGRAARGLPGTHRPPVSPPQSAGASPSHRGRAGLRTGGMLGLHTVWRSAGRDTFLKADWPPPADRTSP